MARPDRSSRNAITASAAIVDLTKPLEIRRQKAARKPWQDEATEFYRTMPEIRYPANFTGGSMSQYLLRVGLLDPADPTAPPSVPDGKDVPDYVKMARDEMEGLQGEQGGVAALLNLYGINMAVTGDGWLFGEDVKEGGVRVDTSWEFLSIKELIFQTHNEGGRQTEEVYRDRTGSGDPYDEANRVAKGAYYRRFWKPHPIFSDLADSPMEALGNDCRRLQLLNESIESRILSRLASNGIFFVPNSITMPTVMEEPAEGNPTEKIEDLVIRRIVAYMEAAITNRDSAAGAMPIFMRGPDDVGEKIKHIVLESDITEQEMALRMELRSNINMGLELPREIGEGLAEASHWTSWSAADSTQTNHIKPSVQRFADGLLRVFLRPALVKKEVERANVRQVVLIADGSEAVAKPNAAEDGRQLHDRIAINDKALRARSGVSEQDAPSDEERLRAIGAKTNNAYLAVWGLKVHDKVDWDKVAAVGASPGAPGVGSTPTDRRKADPSDPSGAPGGRGGAGGVPKSAGK